MPRVDVALIALPTTSIGFLSCGYASKSKPPFKRLLCLALLPAPPPLTLLPMSTPPQFSRSLAFSVSELVVDRCEVSLNLGPSDGSVHLGVI